MKSITHKISIPNILRIARGAFKYIKNILDDEKIEEAIFILDENMFGILQDQIKSITLGLGIDFKYIGIHISIKPEIDTGIITALKECKSLFCQLLQLF